MCSGKNRLWLQTELDSLPALSFLSSCCVCVCARAQAHACKRSFVFHLCSCMECSLITRLLCPWIFLEKILEWVVFLSQISFLPYLTVKSFPLFFKLSSNGISFMKTSLNILELKRFWWHSPPMVHFYASSILFSILICICLQPNSNPGFICFAL